MNANLRICAELGCRHVISGLSVTIIFLKKCHLCVDVHAEPKVVDMTWEGSYMGVLGKNGIVKVGALMSLLPCALKWTEFSDGLHRIRHLFHIILRASQVRSLPSW